MAPWLLASFLAAAVADTNPTGSSSCPCVEWAGLQGYIQGGELKYTPQGSTSSYVYPTNYGNLECKAHDAGLAPHCSGASPPAWCNKPWCYVSTANCVGIQPYRSVKFPGSDAYYSYQTCGESNEFTLWAEAMGTDGTVTSDPTAAPRVTELLDVVMDYLWSTRDSLEAQYVQMMANGSVSACSYIDFCPCVECYQNALWQEKIDPATVGAWLRPSVIGQTTQEWNVLTCLVGLVAATYSSVAAKEGQPLERIGYQYFADQKSGSYIGWPAMDWCPTNYDPRFRPWYASGSTGPKDVLIVVDVSGSMGEASIAAGETSMCQKAIIFLTDGTAEMSNDNFVSVQQQSVTYDVSDFTKTCQQLDTSDCRLQRLRAAVGTESVCEGDVPNTCSCMDPDCQDDASFIDEKGYFCDTWVGDDCSKAQEAWGYSAAGQQAALTRCRRSCGRCSMLSPCPTKERCVGTERFSSSGCRACRTDKVSGVDIQGRQMACPGVSTSATPNAGGASASSSSMRLMAVLVLLARFIVGMSSELSALGIHPHSARPRAEPPLLPDLQVCEELAWLKLPMFTFNDPRGNSLRDPAISVHFANIQQTGCLKVNRIVFH
ncbi:CACNA2D2 [Symbiodinium natans]|uniref:CACNA2D2 protein n=1 Tax=Symbiodinium natans TaxID=878477 RepID=A0A812I5X7_9DINO|nr:CACNA2D2 [Symbiodinium natans]